MMKHEYTEKCTQCSQNTMYLMNKNSNDIYYFYVCSNCGNTIMRYKDTLDEAYLVN